MFYELLIVFGPVATSCGPPEYAPPRKQGDLQVAKWLYEAYFRERRIRTRTIQRAIRRRHLEVLEWLLTAFPETTTAALSPWEVHTVANSDRLDVVEWWWTNRDRSTFEANARSLVVIGGRLDAMRFMYSHCEDASRMFRDDVVEMATASGHLAVLKWLFVYQQGCRSTAVAVLRALRHRHFAVIRLRFPRMLSHVVLLVSHRFAHSAALSGTVELLAWT